MKNILTLMNQKTGIILGALIALSGIAYAASTFVITGSNPRTLPAGLIDYPNGDTKKTVVQEIAQKGITVSQAFRDELDEQHAELFIEVQKAFPLTQGQWQKAIEQLEKLKKEDALFGRNQNGQLPKAEHAVVAKAQAMLIEYGIDPSRVEIYTVDQPQNYFNACAEQGMSPNKVHHRLKINIARIVLLSDDVQEAILRHEMVHLMHYDPLERLIIDDLCAKNGISNADLESNEVVQAYFRHQEFRADLLAVSKNIELAKTFKEHFDNRAKGATNFKVASSHPTYVERAAAIGNLIEYKELEQEVRA